MKQTPLPDDSHRLKLEADGELPSETAIATDANIVLERIANLFLVEPDRLDEKLGKAKPPVEVRKQRRRIMQWLVIFIGGVLIVITSWVSNDLIRGENNRIQLQERGIEVMAQIVSRRIENTGKANLDYYVTFEFQALSSGQSYRHEVWVIESVYQQSLTTTAIRVRYLPEDPATNDLASVQPHGWADIGVSISCFSSLFLVMGAVVILLLFDPWVRQLNYRRRGQVIIGHVERPLRQRWLRNPGFVYVFVSPSGKAIHAKYEDSSRFLRIPRAGTPVAVQYVNDSTYRLL